MDKPNYNISVKFYMIFILKSCKGYIMNICLELRPGACFNPYFAVVVQKTYFKM